MPRIPLALAQLLKRTPTLLPQAQNAARNLTSLASSHLQRVSPISRPAALTPLSFASPSTSSSPILSALGQLRFRTFGAEYQPSQRKRKRKHGFLARKRSLTGRNILKRRLIKGRKYLSH